MSKFTDDFMLIPVRVFHTELEDYDESGDFAIGWARIPYEHLYTATWWEAYPEGTIGLAIKDGGFDLTMIRTYENTYICTWGLKEFEKKLNDFMEKLKVRFDAAEIKRGEEKEDDPIL